jgi:hypothetical protein
MRTWLLCIVVNLIAAGWFDISLRDAGLAVGAFALGRLSKIFDTDLVKTEGAIMQKN